MNNSPVGDPKYPPDKMYDEWRAYRADCLSKGIDPTRREYARRIGLSDVSITLAIQRWRKRLKLRLNPVTKEPGYERWEEELEQIGPEGRESMESRIAAVAAVMPASGFAGKRDDFVEKVVEASDKDSVSELKKEAKRVLATGMRSGKNFDPAKIQAAKAALSIKEVAEDKVPNPYAGMPVDEVVERLLVSCVSMVGTKAIYAKLARLSARKEAEVVGEVSGFRPEGAEAEASLVSDTPENLDG